MAEFGYDRNDNGEFPLCSTAKILNTGTKQNKLPKQGGNLGSLCKFGTPGWADNRTGFAFLPQQIIPRKNWGICKPLLPILDSHLLGLSWNCGFSRHLFCMSPAPPFLVWNLVSPLLRMKGWKLWCPVSCSAWRGEASRRPQSLFQCLRGSKRAGEELLVRARGNGFKLTKDRVRWDIGN